MARHLMLRLASPLIAFGGETIDNFGVIRDFPALSMMTGLLANAMGWDRGDSDAHNLLQERLLVGALLAVPGKRLREYQTAELFENDAGWTTWGSPQGREKSDSYQPNSAGKRALTLQRYRDYHADMTAWVALRLEPEDVAPTIDDIASALDKPKRPLFIGRKPCLPTGRLLAGEIEAASVLEALQVWAVSNGQGGRAQWPDGEGTLPGDRLLDVCDERNWASGVHGGWRPVREGLIASQRGAA